MTDVTLDKEKMMTDVTLDKEKMVIELLQEVIMIKNRAESNIWFAMEQLKESQSTLVSSRLYIDKMMEVLDIKIKPNDNQEAISRRAEEFRREYSEDA